ncbi:MAG TPA: LamG-like jellyroll fold domain-containing protein, partial [Candidatus Eisenbacteria bacterium]|nr:LamG-like jellyroll fold domain-containing protein [Candidatus Eisenbacteria bacterium]
SFAGPVCATTLGAYALGITVVGNGSVSKDPNQALYDHGTVVTLTATPDTGWSFTGWSGDASGSANPLPVTMDAPKNVTATFVLIPDALAFTGTNGYVNFDNPAELKLPTFTIEMWARRDGAGVGTDTGTQGIPDLVPLLAKGRADVEDPLRDINYIVGIKASTGVLAADFEEAAAPSPNPSLNHPVLGKTPLAVGTWYHLAATYDGTTWCLYVNGAMDTSLVVGRAPASASNVAVSLASALNLAGTASGFLNGQVDEVRVWNVARSQAQIAATINQRLSSPTTGLVARWGLDEGTGTTVQSTAGTTINGAITGTGWSWTTGAPFNATPPSPPSAPYGLTATASSATEISLAWIDNSGNETGFEIERSMMGIGGPYSLLATVAANTTSYDDTDLSSSTEYCYQVRAVNDAGPSGYSAPDCATTLAATYALTFSGNTYVTFGDPAALDLPQFTLECWFRRDGAGTETSTGSGGITNA